MNNCFLGIYEGLKVFVTGHTGFKGSWLSIWLKELGAEVIGYSLEAPTEPSLFKACGLEEKVTHIHGDVRDGEHLKRALCRHQPDILFHLAAQPLVLYSYEQPVETFDVNVQGSIHVMEAIRHCPSIKAALMVTTDKVYENREWVWGYRENDRLGGDDPYSASKAMAEIAIRSYRTSFFSGGRAPAAIASARAGNVIGGGDFAANRLIPDTMRALMAGRPVDVRNPSSVRPWVHVLDPLSGYLWLAAKLYMEGDAYAEAWNFGPADSQMIPCAAMVQKAIELWGKGEWEERAIAQAKKEMVLLQLNWEKAASCLQWHPAYDWTEALQETVAWFKEYDLRSANGKDATMYGTCAEHLAAYVAKAEETKIRWALPSFSPCQTL